MTHSRVSPLVVWTRQTAASVLGSLVFAAIETLRILADSNSQDRLLGGAGIFVSLLPAWIIVGLLAPFVWRFGARVTFARDRIAMPMLLHAAGAAAMCVTHYAMLAGFFTMRDGIPFASLWGGLVSVYLIMDVLIYCSIVGISQLWTAQQKLTEREQYALELRASLSDAQLSALKAQLQPHFLFNALNTVSMLVRKQDNQTAVNMLSELGELLRSVLRDSERHEVTLAEDVAMARRYLALEQLRFRDRLAVVVDVPESLQRTNVPALLLQPLVENAVRHGVSRSTGPSTVTVRARYAGDVVQLEVENDAPLFNPNGQRSLASFDGNETRADLEGRNGDGNGVGLANTRMRLHRLYGERASVTFLPGDSTTIVRVEIPTLATSNVQ